MQNRVAWIAWIVAVASMVIASVVIAGCEQEGIVAVDAGLDAGADGSADTVSLSFEPVEFLRRLVP